MVHERGRRRKTLDFALRHLDDYNRVPRRTTIAMVK
jgi:hypothetical protein